MPSTAKPMDATARQRLAAALQGDSKQGSIRSHLARGIAGSPVDDSDGGLVSMTPLGAVMDMYDARNGKGGAGKMVSAAAGMIPGAGPEARAIEELIVSGLKGSRTAGLKAANDAIAHTGMKIKANPEWGEYILQHPGGETSYHDDLQDAFGTARLEHKRQSPQLYTRDPNDINRDHQLETHITDIQDRAEGMKGRGIPPGTRVQDGDTYTPADDLRLSVEESRELKPKSVRQSLKEGLAHGKELRGKIEQPNALEPGVMGNNAGLLQGDLTPEEHAEVMRVAPDDVAKQRFIRNAMMDEGGNVPEEVASTLIDHAYQRGDLSKIAEAAGFHTDDAVEDPSGLAEQMMNTKSIPEMLAMHYDLNPELMSRAYEEGAGGERLTQGVHDHERIAQQLKDGKPKKSRPTQ